LNALSGGVAVRDDEVFFDKLALRTAESTLSFVGTIQQYLTKPVFNLEVSSDKLSLPEIARLVPALAGVKLQPKFQMKMGGPLDRLGIEMNAQSTAGDIWGKVTADVLTPGQSVSGNVSVRHLDLAPILKDPTQQSDITADAQVDLRGESLADFDSLRGNVSLKSPHLAAAGYAAGPVEAKARIDGRRIGLDARASAYGGSATAVGRVTLPATSKAAAAKPIEFDLRGQARHVDLRRLPATLKAPSVETNVNGAYHVAGSVDGAAHVKGDVTFEPSSVAGTSIARGGKAGFEVDGRNVAYSVDANVSNLDLQRIGREFRVAALADVRDKSDINGHITANGHLVDGASDVKGDVTFEPSTVAGAEIARGGTAAFEVGGGNVAYSVDANVSHLDLQRIGRDFKVPALANDRYKSALNGHIVAKGRGTTPETLEVTASGTLTDSTILGGHLPSMSFEAAVASDTLHVKANGDFEAFDPAVVASKPQLKGSVSGALDADVTIARVSAGVTPDSVQARVNAALTPSAIGGLDITAATIDGDYHDSTGEIRTLEVVGHDVNVKANGTIALNETGQSNLTLHADSASLEEIGKLVNQPLSGIAKLDATVTGNRRELKATGTLTGNGLKYGENGALTVSSQYTATIPNLDAASARVTADTHATFVDIGGQHINELDAKTTYHETQLDFDATAKQPERSLGANGSVVLHPEHQEVHLRALGLTSQGVQWQTAPNTEATINYAKGDVSVEGLRLVNVPIGDQQIDVDGAFGRPGDALQVTARNIDVATVDALLLRPPQLSGRLNASATVTGTKDAPHVKGSFQVDKGGFREFTYDTFGGTVDYGGKGFDIDARLQQNPTTWIEAKGYVPMAAFRTTATAGEHAEDVPPEDRFNLHIDSSQVDLGVVQGFTTALTKVTGTFQAKVDITGSAADPHPEGVVTIQNGAFTVEPTGVSYNNLGARIDLHPDKVQIGAISVLDNHFNALNISGELAVHERAVGDVRIYVLADDFKVIDNEMGNVRVNTYLEVTGELRAPRVEGDLGVTTGEVNLDPIMARFGESAYATEQTEFETRPAAAEEKKPAPPLFDALRMNVHLTVPNDLVVKASDLQTPGAPISLGSVNVTFGGDLRATKEPGDQLRLVGIVNTIRGNYDFQGRRFDILRDGSVRFEGTDDFDPRLDIRTERVISGVTANVTIRGHLKQPEIVLTSTPPLEEADILSLIVFNQPINELGAGEQISLAQRAQGLALGAATSELAQSVGGALGLDTFEISTTPEDAGNVAMLTVGQQVGQNLYLKVQQGIGNQALTNFVIEYELTRWLRFRTNVLQEASTQQNIFQRLQGSGFDLLFFFSY
jgi:autotransporter translocation and assembly factor TamB